MLSFFRKKPDPKWGEGFLLQVFALLPEQYACYIEQVKRGIVRGVMTTSAEPPYYLAILYDGQVAAAYEYPAKADFSLFGLNVFDQSLQQYIELELCFYRGLIAGITSQVKLNPKALVLEKIDISSVKIRSTKLDTDVARQLEQFGISYAGSYSDIYAVMLEQQAAIHLRALADGDFLAFREHEFVLVSIAERQYFNVPPQYYELLKQQWQTLPEQSIYAFIEESE